MVARIPAFKSHNKKTSLLLQKGMERLKACLSICLLQPYAFQNWLLTQESRHLSTGQLSAIGKVKGQKAVKKGTWIQMTCNATFDALQNAKKQGATVLTGGGKHPGFSKGFYVQPTVFTDVSLDSQLWNEEVSFPSIAANSQKQYLNILISFHNARRNLKITASQLYLLCGFLT